MIENQPIEPEFRDEVSEPFGHVPTQSEAVRSSPTPSETVRPDPTGSDPNRHGPTESEPIRQGLTPPERKQNHTLTVQEVARMFEAAGVARTERSILRWCRRIEGEVPRLDNDLDPNERRRYITPESVEQVITEEKAKAKRNSLMSGSSLSMEADDLKAFRGNMHSKDTGSEGETGRITELERELQDAKIASGVKEEFIKRLHADRRELIERLERSSYRIGMLETKLTQLGPGRPVDTNSTRMSDGVSSSEPSS